MSKTIIWLVLIAGIVLSLCGLFLMPWPHVIRWWSSYALLRYVLYLTVCTFSVSLGSWWSGWRPLFVGGLVGAVITLLAGVLWPLFVVLWFAIASAILGRGILLLFRIHNGCDNWLINLLVGVGGYGMAVGLLAHLPVNYPGVYGLSLALPLIIGRRSINDLAFAVRCWRGESIPLIRWIWWIDVFIAAVALVYFLVALMPEVGHDALAMHLFIPAHLSLCHQWGFDVGNYVWAVMPMLGDWVYSVGYMLAGETAARLINVGFIFILCWIVRDLVYWAGGTLYGGRIAILIFLSTPLTFTEGSSLFVESVWAVFFVAGTLLLLRSCVSSGNQKIDLPTAGIFLGFALSTKSITLTILPVLFLLLLWSYKQWLRKDFYRCIIIGLAFFFIVGSVPYLTSLLITGNPVFPFFNKVFQSSYYPFVNFESASIFGSGIKWDVLYRVTFNSENFLESNAGAAGFQWLLLFLPGVVIIFIDRHRRGVALFVIGGLSVVLTFQSVSYLRYIFPSLIFFSAVVGVAFSMWSKSLPVLNRFCSVVAVVVVGLNLFFINAGAQYGDFSIISVLGATIRNEYLQSRLPIRNAVEVVNGLNLGRTPVGFFSSPLSAGLAADALYPNWYNYQFNSKIKDADTKDGIAEFLSNEGVDFVILDSTWGTAEKRNLIEDITDEVLVLGSVSVRSLSREYLFQTELLKNPNFYQSDGWQLSGGVECAATGGVTVSVVSPASQVVPVQSGYRYLNTVKACFKDQPSQARLQVNWLDSNNQFISTDIQVFDCIASFVEHSMEVIAPSNAAYAVVYASGHTPTPILFKEVSFRK